MESKIPSYHIVNIFLPGLMLTGSCILLFFDEVKIIVQAISNLGSTGLETLITVSLFATAYEIGYILFRLGSTAIEPILRKLCACGEYSDFIAARETSERAHDKLEMLSREYGYARTRITLFIILITLTGVHAQWWAMAACAICVGLFILTAHGHMKRIQKAVKQYLGDESSR